MKIVVLPNTKPDKLVISEPGEQEIVIEDRIHAMQYLNKIIDSFFGPENKTEVGNNVLINTAWNED